MVARIGTTNAPEGASHEQDPEGIDEAGGIDAAAQDWDREASALRNSSQLNVWFESTIPATMIPMASKIRIAIYRYKNSSGYDQGFEEGNKAETGKEPLKDHSASPSRRSKSTRRMRGNTSASLGTVDTVEEATASDAFAGASSDVAARLSHAEHAARAEIDMVASVFLPIAEFRSRGEIWRYCTAVQAPSGSEDKCSSDDNNGGAQARSGSIGTDDVRSEPGIATRAEASGQIPVREANMRTARDCAHETDCSSDSDTTSTLCSSRGQHSDSDNDSYSCCSDSDSDSFELSQPLMYRQGTALPFHRQPPPLAQSGSSNNESPRFSSARSVRNSGRRSRSHSRHGKQRTGSLSTPVDGVGSAAGLRRRSLTNSSSGLDGTGSWAPVTPHGDGRSIPVVLRNSNLAVGDDGSEGDIEDDEDDILNVAALAEASQRDYPGYKWQWVAGFRTLATNFQENSNNSAVGAESRVKRQSSRNLRTAPVCVIA